MPAKSHKLASREGRSVTFSESQKAATQRVDLNKEASREESSTKIAMRSQKSRDSQADDDSGGEAMSRRTSFSEFYVIDEAEEHRLKQIAMERYLAEK